MIAIFTFVLAVKTSGLFRETAGLREAANKQAADTKDSIDIARKAAEAANLHARAAVSVELPSLHVEDVFCPLKKTHSFKEWMKTFSISVQIRNYGRTPAFVSEVIVKAIMVPVLPFPRIINGIQNIPIASPFAVMANTNLPSITIF